MNLEQLLNLRCEYVERSLYGLNEILDCNTSGACLIVDEDGRLYQKVFKHHSFDGRRGWFLSVLMLDDEPVAVIQQAGRELRDHQKVLPINSKKYLKACRYLDSLSVQETEYISPEITPEDDVTTFYGQKLECSFDIY